MSFQFGGDNNTFTLDPTVAAELPPSFDYGPPSVIYGSSDYGPTMQTMGTSSQPALAEIQRSDPGFSLSGILSGVNSTAQSLLQTWGQVNNIQDSVANAQLQRTIATQTAALQNTKTLSAIDLAGKQTTASTAVETARINASVANDMAKIASSSPGAIAAAASQSKMYLIVGAALIAFYIYKKG